MICVSIAQESRRMALVDILNAGMLGADLIEVRLDCFEKDPNVGELFQLKQKPLIATCRRAADGGSWDGTEDERLALLRLAMVSGAEYVEIEHDAADQIRPYPGCKRVISYTNLKETPADIGAIYADMLTKKPDVIKLVTRARTPEEAWPLVQLLPKATVPTLAYGIGRPGVTLAVMGARLGAPWTVAALERGMEAYPGQPTVRDLEQVYAFREIDRKTKFVGVTGLTERDFLLTGLLNKAFAELGSPLRCLPLQKGGSKVFKQVIDGVHLRAVFLDEGARENVHELAALDESARAPVQAADVIRPADAGWAASNRVGPAAVAALEAAMPARGDGESPLKGRVAALVGASPTVRMIAPILKAKGAALIFACKLREDAARMAQLFGGRQILFDALYTTMHDVLVVAESPDADPDDPDAEADPLAHRVHPGYLRKGMTVLDLSAVPRRTKLLTEAAYRGCRVVDPRRLLVEQAREYAELVTGQSAPAAALAEWLGGWVEE